MKGHQSISIESIKKAVHWRNSELPVLSLVHYLSYSYT
jgi:hypothetical protein